VLAVTESLHSALKRLRSSKSCLFWADAVYINQDDNVEKSQQVRLMQRIYSGSSLIIVDLGEEADNSALALPAFEILARDDKSCIPSVSQSKTQGLEPADAVGPLGMPSKLSQTVVPPHMGGAGVCGCQTDSHDLRVVEY
jgi:hypothetical protein